MLPSHITARAVFTCATLPTSATAAAATARSVRRAFVAVSATWRVSSTAVAVITRAQSAPRSACGAGSLAAVAVTSAARRPQVVGGIVSRGFTTGSGVSAPNEFNSGAVDLRKGLDQILTLLDTLNAEQALAADTADVALDLELREPVDEQWARAFGDARDALGGGRARAAFEVRTQRSAWW